MFSPGETALFLAPHTDDAELCCGGTISKMVDLGVDVSVLNLSMATGAVKEESWAAMEKLGVKGTSVSHMLLETRALHEKRQEILEWFRELATQKFDYVFVPSRDDTHQDHQTVAEESFRAFKFGTILAWESPWNNIRFSPTLFCTFTGDDLARKIVAVDQYRSQLHRFYFSEEYLVSWARMRGGQVNQGYAEAFEVVRMLT